jgi:hypothetical protein
MPQRQAVHGAIQTQGKWQPPPDATIAELRAWLSKTHQVSASPAKPTALSDTPGCYAPSRPTCRNNA